MSLIGFVALGSAAGAPTRYLLDRFIQSRHERILPFGTWLINITGCFSLGLLTGVVQHHGVEPRVLAAAATGFIGSYTTFSTFTWETMRLVEDDAFFSALANVVVSTSVGMAAAATGLLLGTA